MSNRALTLMMGVVGVLILVVGGIFAIVLLSGGGDDNEGGATTQNSNNSGGSGSVKPGEICKGKTFVTFGADPATLLDPAQVRDEGTSEYIVEIFGGLVTLDLDLKVQPDLAKEWKVSPDGKTYTFTLRDNIVFHNGQRVTANDVKYSLERAADPKTASPTATLYLGDIVGLRDKFTGKANEISGVKVIDEKTITIEITQPAQFFLAALTYPVAFVVDQKQIEADPRNWTRNPNGTGPFRLAEFKPAELIRLVRNDRYHLGPAKLEQVIFELGGGSILTRYQNDEIYVGGVPASDLELVKSGGSPLSNQYKPRPRMTVTYLAFNLEKAPFDDIKVREALALALDQDQINDVLLFETQRVADGILPPETPGYNESIKGYEYNPTRAKQLLSESKYASNMPRIILTYAGSGGDAPDILAAYQAMWKDTLGIDVELQASEYSAYLRELRNGTFQMFSAGWAADYPDPEDFLDKLFESESPQNEQGYSNPNVDRLLDQARYESDTQTRYRLYSQAEQMILDDFAIIPNFWPVEHLLVKPCVENWPSISMTVPSYRYIDIKED